MADRRLRPPGVKSVRAALDEGVEDGDLIDYGLTEEVSPAPGRKAWVKFGTTSAVRHGESAEDAVRRITKFVNDGLDARIDELS